MHNAQDEKNSADGRHEITVEDLREFSQARSHQERLRILMAHSEKNKKRIEIRRKKQMEKTQQQIEQEMLELNEQFSAFLHTKGIVAKFKLAFSDMAESARKQRKADAARLEAVKAKSAEENKEFVEFLHTKGIKAKFRLVIENIRKGAKETSQKTAAQIAKVRAQTQASIAQSRAYGSPYAEAPKAYTAETLAEEFNAFLKAKGLDSEYTVVITEENETA